MANFVPKSGKGAAHGPAQAAADAVLCRVLCRLLWLLQCGGEI